MKKIYAVATESDVVLAFESRAHANAAARRCRRPWRVTPRWC